MTEEKNEKIEITETDNYEPIEFFQTYRLHSLGKMFAIRDHLIHYLPYIEFYEERGVKKIANSLLREIELVIEDAFRKIKPK